MIDTAGLEEADKDSLAGRMRAQTETAIEQADALLEQPVAAFGIAQLREQTCQLGAGFRTMIETQARLQIVARLAPQRIAQAEPPESQQQDGILRVILQPALGIGQLARRIAALHTPIAFHQAIVVLPFDRRVEHLFGLRLRAQTSEPVRIGAHHQWLPALRAGNGLPTLIQRLQARLRGQFGRLPGLLDRRRPRQYFQFAQARRWQHSMLAQLRQQAARAEQEKSLAQLSMRQ